MPHCPSVPRHHAESVAHPSRVVFSSSSYSSSAIFTGLNLAHLFIPRDRHRLPKSKVFSRSTRQMSARATGASIVFPFSDIIFFLLCYILNSP